MTRRFAAALLAGLALFAFSLAGRGQDKSKYPRVDAAAGYKVDPTWPRKPSGYTWGHVPGVAVDKNDHVYITTRSQPPVQVYDASGKFLRGWGEDTIKSPHHVRVAPDGNIWVADTELHQVLEFTPTGRLLRALGTRGAKGADDRTFNAPTDMAITPAGEVFVADGYGNARVVHLDKKGKFVKAWGSLGSKPGQFSIAHSIAVDSRGRLYVADRNNVRVQVFEPSGKLVDVWDNVVTPWGLWVTPKDEIWVCGSSPMRWRPTDQALGCPPKDQVLMKFNPTGRLLQFWAVPKGTDGKEQPGELNWVHAIAEDSRGNLYAGDINGKRVQKFVREE